MDVLLSLAMLLLLLSIFDFIKHTINPPNLEEAKLSTQARLCLSVGLAILGSFAFIFILGYHIIPVHVYFPWTIAFFLNALAPKKIENRKVGFFEQFRIWYHFSRKGLSQSPWSAGVIPFLLSLISLSLR